MVEKNETDWVYDCVYQIIRSPEFRNPIKDFIDDNCSTFVGLDENTFEQGDLHKKFMELIDSLLEILVKDIGITDEMFCMSAKKGLEDEKCKKYFEQLISFTNFIYFKNLMTKRNFQLEELALAKMLEGKNENGEDEAIPNELKEELEKKKKEYEENELQCAIKMSMAAEEEKKKLEALEEEELKKAIELSLQEESNRQVKPPILIAQPAPKPQKSEVKKEPEPVAAPIKEQPLPAEIPKEQKINPVDKVALKQKMLLEHDAKVKLGANQKLPPLSFVQGNNNAGLNKQLNDIEEAKAKRLQEYRELVLKMKKEKREKEVDDILAVEPNKMSEEDRKRLELRKQLAAKLKEGGNIRK